MNEQNLRPILTSQRARELQEKSVAKRKENIAKRKTLKEQLLLILNDETIQDNICKNIIKRAEKGDIKAFEVVRDTIGEKPSEKVDITSNNISVTLDD